MINLNDLIHKQQKNLRFLTNKYKTCIDNAFKEKNRHIFVYEMGFKDILF